MHHFKITCDNGDTWQTGFNGTLAQATAYFLGQTFVKSEDAETGAEVKHTVVSVEVV